MFGENILATLCFWMSVESESPILFRLDKIFELLGTRGRVFLPVRFHPEAYIPTYLTSFSKLLVNLHSRHQPHKTKKIGLTWSQNFWLRPQEGTSKPEEKL
jgi:hypothetical protein